MGRGLALFLLLLQIPAGSFVRGSPMDLRPLQAKLETRVKNYQLVADNFVDALLRVAGEYKIPMGIAWVRTPAATRSVKLSWKVATVGEIVNDVVRLQPGYKVNVKDGILHVSDPRLIPDRQNFLRLRVHEFVVSNEVVEMAERRLVNVVNATVVPPPA